MLGFGRLRGRGAGLGISAICSSHARTHGERATARSSPRKLPVECGTCARARATGGRRVRRARARRRSTFNARPRYSVHRGTVVLASLTRVDCRACLRTCKRRSRHISRTHLIQQVRPAWLFSSEGGRGHVRTYVEYTVTRQIPPDASTYSSTDLRHLISQEGVKRQRRHLFVSTTKNRHAPSTNREQQGPTVLRGTGLHLRPVARGTGHDDAAAPDADAVFNLCWLATSMESRASRASRGAVK